MSVENWSESIVLAELQDDPAFTDDLNALLEQLHGDEQLMQMTLHLLHKV